MVICDKCGKGSYECGGQPICCWCGRKISCEAKRVPTPRADLDQPSEAEIQAALDFGRTADQHLN